MAFGFGFNKQKLLSAAEKFVQQGKLQNAIAEYEKIRKNDEKDLTVANTIGDLYARMGDSTKAIECFKTVGDAYAAQGFTVKGIAMYKKITKLQPSVDGSLKLAELYTQQGLFNDARAQYLQVAEDFMKNGDLEQSVRLFQKVLEMDPENVPMRIKLAEVYIRLGKKKEAWEIFSAAAEALRARGSMPAAEDVLKRMLQLDPGNSYVLLLRGRAALESGDPKSAIQYLEKASDIDSHPEGLRDLLKAYLEDGDLDRCAPIAEKLLTVHNDPEGLFLLGEGAARLGHYDQALDVYSKHADRLLATDSTKLLSNLHTMITRVRDDSGALEKLMELVQKSGETTHVNEVAELLAHSSVKDGNLERARDLYTMLATSEPQNAMHMQNYQQVVDRMAGTTPQSGHGITAEEGGLIVEELEATAPVIDQSYPDDIAVAVRSAVTEADLFLSYNLPDKAIVPLLGALPQAPRDVRLNQRLAALHTRFQHFSDAAVCCRTLESSYHDAGYPDEAIRYGELASRYEQSAGVGIAPAPAEVASIPAAWPARISQPEPAAHPEFAVHEMEVQAPAASHDLSDEWEQTLSVDEPALETAVPAAPPAVHEGHAESEVDEDNPEIAETAEEIRFYLEHFMNDQARSAFEKLETLTRNATILEPLRVALASASQAAEEPQVEIADNNLPEINADEPETFDVELDAQPAAEFAASPDLMAGYSHGDAADHGTQHEHQEPVHAGEMHVTPAHFEAPAEPTHVDATDDEASHVEPSHAEPVHASAEPEPEPDELSALVADLEASIGDSFPVAPPAHEPDTVTRTSGSREHPSDQSGDSLPSWPIAAPSKRTVPQPEPQTLEPVAHADATPIAADSLPVVTASSGAAAAAPALSYGPTPVRPLGAGAQAMHPSDSIDLSEMFGELKHELEEDIASGDDDPETHYNMGVAFREMGLLDEAITELQKVCTSIDRGHAFPQTIQTYTWLAQCFLDKGVPDAAIRWYEKALNIPGIDSEARVAINYELGSACERAEDKPAALRHFTYVYGANIDYRDVAERIQALKS
jgi:tetratricopeptide (TPR) repeat protein